MCVNIILFICSYRSSSYTIPANLSASSHAPLIMPIGFPISQTIFYLVKPDVTPYELIANKGDEGELWIGGVGVAAGYLKRLDLTEQKFLKDPFRREGEGEGFAYCPGDLVNQNEVIDIHTYIIQVYEVYV